MRIAVLVLALAIPDLCLPAQKLYDAVNSPPVSPAFALTGAAWFLIKRTNPTPITLTAAQMYLIDFNAPTVTLDVGVWDVDPLLGRPRTLLGSGSFVLQQDVPGWYGATFVTPVVLGSAGSYFVGVRMPNAIVGMAANGTVSTPYWHNANGSGWTGPLNGNNLSVRVYAAQHPQQQTAYGVGKPGAGAVVPEIEGIGWPCTGNPYGARLVLAATAVPCAFFVGTRSNTVLPFATIYSTPIVAVGATTLSSGSMRGRGHAEVETAIPNDPALQGALVAWQVLIADPLASLGIAHTRGLEITIGH